MDESNNNEVTNEKPVKKTKAGLIIGIFAGIVVLLFAGVVAFFYFLSPKTAPWLCKHVYTKSTCEHDMECPRCGEFLKKAKKHDWIDATCEEPAICDECGEEDGEPLGHKWIDATCETPKTCSVCGKTEGEAADHIWKAATCTTPKTCSVCGLTEGNPANHQWMDATCIAPKTCAACGMTEGTALEHDYDDNFTCKNCNKFNVTKEDLGKIIAFKKNGVKKYSGSSSIALFQITNKSKKKTIKNVTFILIFTDDNGTTVANGKCTYASKIKPGKKSPKNYGWIILQPKSKLKNYIITNVVIQYTDGTELDLGQITIP